MNQKGFIYPLTTIISLLLCTVILYQVDAYLTEKHFIYEQERMLQLESLLQVAIFDFQKSNVEPNVNESYVFSYEPGTVTVEVRDYDEEGGISNIFMRARLTTGHERIAGYSYHWENASVEQYWEISNSVTMMGPLQNVI